MRSGWKPRAGSSSETLRRGSGAFFQTSTSVGYCRSKRTRRISARRVTLGGPWWCQVAIGLGKGPPRESATIGVRGCVLVLRHNSQ